MQSCRQKEELMELQGQDVSHASMTRSELNQTIFDILLEKEDFGWNDLNDEQLTSAFLLSEKMITVAWDENATSDVEKRIIIDFIYQSEGKPVDEEGVILEVDDELRLLHAKIDKVETLLGLRRLNETVALDVYYEIFTEEEVEQAVRESQQHLPSNSQKTNGYPSFFLNHQIDAAHNAGLSGAGLEIAVVDNGPDTNDPVWGQNGNPHGNNPQPNRSVEKRGRYKPLWWWPWASYDGLYNTNPALSHGSDMLKKIGNPLGANSQGIAYRADIRSVRGNWWVWIDLPANVYGVTKSVKYLAKKSDVKIISMSLGGLVNWVSIRRAIQKCYDRDKLVLSGAGTLPGAHLLASVFGSGSQGNITLFPARLQDITLAATGIRPTNDLNNATWCPWCFGKADFVAEFNSGGSSSVSTALTAGIAALIWAREPFLSPSDVIGKMRAASDMPNSPHQDFGYGRINMQTYIDNEGI